MLLLLGVIVIAYQIDLFNKVFSELISVRKMILSGKILKQRSIRLRVNHWKTIFTFIKQAPILGWGPGKNLVSIADSDYIFTIFRYGIVGALLKYSLYAYILIKSLFYFRVSKNRFSLFIFSVVSSLFVYGTMLDIFTNLKLVPIILFLCGIFLGHQRVNLKT